MSNWWESGGATGAIAVYQPIGASSLANSYINLCNPGTYDAAPGVAPTFNTATGWTFNGSTQYLTTGVIVGTGWTIIARFSSWTSSVDSYAMGSYQVAGAVLCALSPKTNVGNSPTWWNGSSGSSGFLATGAAMTSGIMCVAGPNCYRDGSSVGTLTNSSAPTPSLYLGALNASGSASNFANGTIQAIAIYNTTLTGAQVAAVTRAMARLGTTLPAWTTAGGVSEDNLIAAYQPIGADDLADSYINLAAPGINNAAPGVAPTFNTATGWTFNGSTQYLTTGLTPTASSTMLIRFEGITQIGIVCGSLGASSTRYWLWPDLQAYGPLNTRNYGNGNDVQASPGVVSGVMGVAGLQGYLDGVADLTISGGGGSSYAPVYIGALNNSGPGFYKNARVSAFAFYSGTLTAGQVAAVTTCMQNLPAACGGGGSALLLRIQTEWHRAVFEGGVPIG